MIIGVASGKGGTGKTTVAVNLAAAVEAWGPRLLDCDVEEPNAHLFINPVITARERVMIEVPEVDAERCSHCGKCRDICRFNAIALLPDSVLTFPELCHGCGGCFLVCPENAVFAGHRELGWVETGSRGNIQFAHGLLRVGEAMAPPLIRGVREKAAGAETVIIDAPPGTSCPVVAALKGVDFVVLVAESTPFGLNDLELAAATVDAMGLPAGIVINRSDLGDGCVAEFAARERLPVLAEIPFDREAAEASAQGLVLIDHLPRWRRAMEDLWVEIRRRTASAGFTGVNIEGEVSA